MRTKLLALAFAAIALTAMGVPAHSQPLTFNAAVFRSAGSYESTCTLTVNGCAQSTYSGVNVISNVSVDNFTGNVTPAADFTANAYSETCTYTPMYSCASWNAPDQIVSPTALQMDPLENSATFTATLRDSSGNNHSINITLTRPTTNGVGYSNPNAWVDGQSAQVSVSYLGFSRNGFVVNGTIDSTTLSNTPCVAIGICGNTGGYTNQSVYNTFAQVN
ncbi:MAG: hypothetical protein ACYDCC_10365 [Actinomycetota bacterium]